MADKIRIRYSEAGWAKCWLKDCLKPTEVLVEFKKQESFRRCWYCLEHAKWMLKQRRPSHVLETLVNDGLGHLKSRKHERLGANTRK